MYGGTAFLVVCLCNAPTTSVKVWAREEAKGRNNPLDPDHVVTIGEHVEAADPVQWVGRLGKPPSVAGDEDE